MAEMKLYRALSRLPWLNYRGKIMLTAFVGIHVPLLALIGLFAFWTAPTLSQALTVIAVALVATLAGTGATLWVLLQLLEPMLKTGQALRAYALDRTLTDLPTGFDDEAGRLMADAAHAIGKLDGALTELTYYDGVTGLPNRDRLLSSLADRAPDAPYALVAFRFGSYERLLAAYGQDGADGALRVLARRLETAAGRGSLVARVEGNVLAAVLAGSMGPEAAADAVGAIAAALRAELGHGFGTVMPEIGCGVAFHPHDGADPAVLLDHALVAVADALPGGEVRFYSTGSREAARTRFRIEQDLRRALAEDRFVLHFQPFIDAAANRLVGAEALIRWNHPELGLIGPGQFIPIVEAAGLAGDVGLWVLKKACQEAARWRQADPGFKVAVNLSPFQFRDPGLVMAVGDTLAKAGLSPAALELELTETAAMEDPDAARRVLASLRELGVSVAIDDFGTGFSSLSQLKNLPFDRLKIDRSFVHNVDSDRDSQAICRTVVELGRGLGIDVIGEGTETEAELREMLRLGCRLFQGYYFSRPVPAAELTALTRGRDWNAGGGMVVAA